MTSHSETGHPVAVWGFRGLRAEGMFSRAKVHYEKLVSELFN
jgi:hypothetical protein